MRFGRFQKWGEDPSPKFSAFWDPSNWSSCWSSLPLQISEKTNKLPRFLEVIINCIILRNCLAFKNSRFWWLQVKVFSASYQWTSCYICQPYNWFEKISHLPNLSHVSSHACFFSPVKCKSLLIRKRYNVL